MNNVGKNDAIRPCPIFALKGSIPIAGRTVEQQKRERGGNKKWKEGREERVGKADKAGG